MLGVSIVLFVVLLAVLFAVAAVTAGFGDLMKPTFQDVRPVGMPEHVVGPNDLEALRFNVVLRGYKMTEVDAVLRRLSRELAERDAVLAELRNQGVRTSFRPEPPVSPPAQPPAAAVAPVAQPVAEPVAAPEPDTGFDPAAYRTVGQDEPTAEFFPTFADDTAVLPVVEDEAAEPEPSGD